MEYHLWCVFFVRTQQLLESQRRVTPRGSRGAAACAGVFTLTLSYRYTIRALTQTACSMRGNDGRVCPGCSCV